MPRKKKNDITIGDVVILLNDLYEKAKTLEYVQKRISQKLILSKTNYFILFKYS